MRTSCGPCPDKTTVSQLAKYFSLSEKKIRAVLSFLTDKGLAISEDSQFKTGPVSIHLGEDSANINKHHMNWRVRAMESFGQRREEDIHYSSVISIAQEDEVKVRDILINAIEKIRNVVRDSEEDSVYSYCIDFFCLEHMK